MARFGGAVLDVPAWEDVSSEQPCRQCGATSGCSVLADGEFVRCLKVISQWPVAGGGWLHRVGQAQPIRALAS